MNGVVTMKPLFMKLLFLLLLLDSSASNAQWENVPEISNASIVYALLAVHDTLFAGADSLVYVGASGGTEWFVGLPPAGDSSIISCLLKDKNVLFAGTFRNGIFRSTNDGLSWQPLRSGLAGLGAMDISSLLVRRDSLIAGTLGAGVFVTASDVSHPWASWGDSLASYQGENVFKMLTVGNTVLAGAGANGYMFRFTDAQPWWNPIAINSPRLVGHSVSGLASGATAVVAGTNAGIYRSTDEGLSWEQTAASVPPHTFAIALAFHESTFFALTTTPLSSSLLMSSDEGQIWESLGTFPMPNLFDIAIVGETVYLGGSGGLWRAPLSRLITTADETATAPHAFMLRNNYPNPFNPSTTIAYELPTPADVRLSVFDMLGCEVSVLVNERKNAGTHEARFDAAGLASGVYLCRLEAGGIVRSQKMIFMR